MRLRKGLNEMANPETTRGVRKHIRSPYTHDPLCGASSKIALMNRDSAERIYCALVDGTGQHPCLECVLQLAFTLSDGKIGLKEAA